MSVKINTVAVLATANRIDNYNKKICDELTELKLSINALRNYWEGEAANSGINKFDYIERNYSDSRFLVLNNVVSFMKAQVGECYDDTEQKILTAASAFK